MKKEIPQIKERVEELVEQLRRELKARRKTRLEALYLLKRGLARTREQVAELLAVHRHTVGQWLEKYESQGVRGMLEMKTHSNRKPVLEAGVRQALMERLKAEKGVGSYGEVQRWLKEKYGVAVKYKTLHGVIHYQLKGLKVPTNVVLIPLPPYSPELNPIERLWQDLKRHFAGQVFESLPALKDRVAGVLRGYRQEELRSLTGYAYIVEAVNGLVL